MKKKSRRENRQRRSKAPNVVESKLTCPLGMSDSALNHRLPGVYLSVIRHGEAISFLNVTADLFLFV